MGTLNLTCPLCCDETFNSLKLLKDHLLSMANFYCPTGCSFRSDSVAELIQHLDECIQLEDVTFSTDTDDLKLNENDVLMDDNDEEISDAFLVNNSQEIMIMDGGQNARIEIDENGEFKVYEGNTIETEIPKGISEDLTSEIEENPPVLSIPETGSVKNENDNDDTSVSMFQDESIEFLEDEQSLIELDDQESINDQVLDNASVTESACYSCSTCGISFDSVADHINQYHSNQEVVFEMAEGVMEEAETIVPEETEPIVPKTRQRQTLNTIRTEECIDSEGRFYTRKVVQIEPFWDRTNNPVPILPKPPSMIEKFFKARSGTEETTTTTTAASVTTTEKPATTTAVATPPPPQKLRRCQQCLKLFTEPGELRFHVCANGNKQCEHCDQAFASIKALQLHLKTHNTDEQIQNIFICQICGTRFTSHKSLRLHTRMHAPVRARHVEAPAGDSDLCFTCQECGKTLSESYRKEHMALHTSDSVTCSVCNRKFDSTESLGMHLAVHPELGIQQNQTIAEQNTQIDPLSVSPNSPATSLSTVTPIDSSTTAIAATTTTTTITTTASSNVVPAVSDDPTKPYQCQHCPKRFTRPHEKVKHERIHTGEKPHSCEVCGKTFRVSYCLTLHMRTHTGQRPYECKTCNKRFKASSVYNHHVLTHSDTRAYKCPHCDKRFKTRVQLAGHKNSHTKPFRCTECSRPFASLYAARAHMQTHKKDNNLKHNCDICGASYGRAFALNDHMKVHNTVAVIDNPASSSRDEESQDDFILNEEITEEELIQDPQL